MVEKKFAHVCGKIEERTEESNNITKDLGNMTHEERLKGLDLFSLKKRTPRGRII